MQELMGLRVSNNSLEGVSDFLTRFRDLRARSSCDDEWTLGLLRTELLGFSNQGYPVTSIGRNPAQAPFAAQDESEAATGTTPPAERLIKRLENSVNTAIRNASLMGQHQHQKGQAKFNQWGGKGQQQVHLTGEFCICDYCNKKNHTADECYVKAQDILNARDEKKCTKSTGRGRGRGRGKGMDFDGEGRRERAGYPGTGRRATAETA